MKKLNLCKTCPEVKYCFERCLEALACEEEDNSNLIDSHYKSYTRESRLSELLDKDKDEKDIRREVKRHNNRRHHNNI